MEYIIVVDMVKVITGLLVTVTTASILTLTLGERIIMRIVGIVGMVAGITLAWTISSILN